MGGTLKFDIEGLRGLIDHAERSTEWTQGWGDSDTGAKPRPQIMFVKDQGVYLMSNGNAEPLPEAQRVIYAKGFDPSKARDFDAMYEKSRRVCGGDDFAEYFDTSDLTIPEGAVTFVIKVTTRNIEIGFEIVQTPATASGGR